ncbi:amidohydrolase family protein [Actinocorallia sp. A-T 12471]|uniref:amidohydrolase family protein n=1 Tax=Actinocorallia sp. A-T 12471 TaxID=3089813 RepID=UPI0029CBE488|nr:amidohydrolase family protein [Actinocorallia sp. A-T 12471]MDX6742921.1 amidohydrolase family protein [Actinocorallia sp. A-T 12471]
MSKASALRPQIDAAGGVLLPGLIDAHVHVHGPESLDALARYGVTTGLDMAAWPAELPASLRGAKGTCDIQSAGLPAIGPGGAHAHMPKMSKDAIVTDPALARDWVAVRVAEGSEYIKLVFEAPGGGGVPADAARELVRAAHDAGRQTIAHVASAAAVTMAIDAGVDFITHVPLGAPIEPADVTRMLDGGRVAIPTLIMMRGVAEGMGRPEGFAGSVRTVAALHEAGVPILVGTDANDEPGAPFAVKHGESIHEELELLVQAGLTPLEVLHSATSLTARYFGLDDRGSITPGKRADLLLIAADPLADISATRAVQRVWCAGIEHETA